MDTDNAKAQTPNLKARVERLEETVNSYGERLREHRTDINGLADEIGSTVVSDRTHVAPSNR